VIIDWVPAHFPRDDWALARFDGTALYEHADPRQGEHPDWGTLVFNFGRYEVRNFLVANALYWLEEFHIDGLRVDAVASMLYLDYSREARRVGPQPHGGNENLEAIDFLREDERRRVRAHPGAMMIAEESTAWPSVSRPVDHGGLGFGFKWNMGWMHDTLAYFEHDPVHRRYHHRRPDVRPAVRLLGELRAAAQPRRGGARQGLADRQDAGRPSGRSSPTCAPVRLHVGPPRQEAAVHGRRDRPGREWNHDAASTGTCSTTPCRCPPASSDLVRDLNRALPHEPALHERDCEPDGFEWIDATAPRPSASGRRMRSGST
jgi:1,4-alpha-glucan branching enzyme